MFIIEKCCKPNLSARFKESERHLWSPKGKTEDSTFECNSLEEAIAIFKEKTARTRSASLRLRALGSGDVLCAKNTSDAHYFEQFEIDAVGFSELVPQDTGAKFSSLNDLSQALSSQVITHDVTTRANSNGSSFGAYLVTDLTSGVGSNSDVGISVRNDIVELSVSRRFLLDQGLVEEGCNHRSEHKSIQCALLRMKEIVRPATESQLAVFQLAKIQG